MSICYRTNFCLTEKIQLFFVRLFRVLELKNVAHFVDGLQSLKSKKRKVIFNDGVLPSIFAS